MNFALSPFILQANSFLVPAELIRNIHFNHSYFSCGKLCWITLRIYGISDKILNGSGRIYASTTVHAELFRYIHFDHSYFSCGKLCWITLRIYGISDKILNSRGRIYASTTVHAELFRYIHIDHSLLFMRKTLSTFNFFRHGGFQLLTFNF